MVKIIVNKSQLNSVKPGIIYMWSEEMEDTKPGDGKLAIDVIVVQGSLINKNKKKLTLYIKPPITTIFTIPHGTQFYKNRYQKN